MEWNECYLQFLPIVEGIKMSFWGKWEEWVFPLKHTIPSYLTSKRGNGLSIISYLNSQTREWKAYS